VAATHIEIPPLAGDTGPPFEAGFVFLGLKNSLINGPRIEGASGQSLTRAVIAASLYCDSMTTQR
jgi:hypothetical protein